MRRPAGYVIARPHPAPWPRSPELDRAIRYVIAWAEREEA
jgi:hypothetical protein